MNTELRLTTSADAYIVKNLWPLYAHEVSAFSPTLPNAHGLIVDDDELKTLGEQGASQAAWWKHPEWLFPYLILADGRPAGFNMIAQGPYVPEGVEADVLVYEFFVVHAFRSKGVAAAAARLGFDLHPGRWEVVTHPPNARAIAFWRRVIGGYADGFSEREGDHPFGRKIIFTFENTAGG